MAATAIPATKRSERTASTSAPPGICPIRETKPAAESTRPISTCVHFCVVRKTETNGPKPVCTSATKKMNQSSPRRLRADGALRCRSCLRAPPYWSGLSPRRLVAPRTECISGICCYSGSGTSLPSAPRTTTGLPSLYSGAALTWSRVRFEARSARRVCRAPENAARSSRPRSCGCRRRGSRRNR